MAVTGVNVSFSQSSRAAGTVLVNPSPALLGQSNAVVAGRARQYEVASFAGPLSVKSVVSGRARWETAAGRFEVRPGSALVLNDGEEYSMEIDALQPVETFCIFFARGFVEDAYRAAVNSSQRLLDAVEAPPMPCFERLHHGRLAGAMATAHHDAASGRQMEPSLVVIASLLASAVADTRQRIRRMPPLRASTREELSRRVARATEYIHANLGEPLALKELAAAACLSPFHFHRMFSALHGLTPHRYIVRLRLERAHTLLLHTPDPVADVAFACGFESVGSFTTLFRRRFGVPPARFRKIGEEERRSPHYDRRHE